MNNNFNNQNLNQIIIKNQNIHVCRLSGRLTACDLRDSRRCYANRLKTNKNNLIRKNSIKKLNKIKRIKRKEENIKKEEILIIQKLENSPNGKISKRQKGFYSPPNLQKTTNEFNNKISNHLQMPTCHRNCHFTPSSQRPILKVIT
uniref:Uncharacterized protein n=1 Tax=Meloidogyne hapla TaxID=6305 RepID=A0A1I8BZD0_MELHA